MSQYSQGSTGGGGGGTINEIDGTAFEITVTNGMGPITTLSTPITFIAPGSIASTTTNAAGTNFLLPLGSTTAGMILQNQGGLVRVFSTIGIDNIFVGRNSGNLGLTPGVAQSNSGFGAGALGGVGFTTGDGNTAIGASSLSNAGFNGNYNIAIGAGAVGLTGGDNYSGTEASNILLGSDGVVGDSHVMRLGQTGSGNGQVSTAFIAGTQGVTPSGTLQTVVINSSGQLGSAAIPASTITQFDVLVGGAANAINSVGPGTAGQVLQSGGNAANPAYSTATYPSTTTVSQLLYSSATNVVSGLATANRAVITTGATGVPVATALATDGQLIIGSTAGAPAAATLSAGTGISVSNASNSITIASTGGGLTWSTVTGTTQAIAVNNGYVANNAGLVTATLPSTASLGDKIQITGINNATGWKIAQNASQQIFFGNQNTTSGTGGSLASTGTRDFVELTCVVAGSSTVYNVTASIGNITVV